MKVKPDYLVEIGTDFVFGKGHENSVIVGGGALNSVQNWKPIKDKVTQGLLNIISDGKASSGEAFVSSYSPGNIKNGRKIIGINQENGFYPSMFLEVLLLLSELMEMGNLLLFLFMIVKLCHLSPTII